MNNTDKPFYFECTHGPHDDRKAVLIPVLATGHGNGAMTEDARAVLGSAVRWKSVEDRDQLGTAYDAEGNAIDMAEAYAKRHHTQVRCPECGVTARIDGYTLVVMINTAEKEGLDRLPLLGAESRAEGLRKGRNRR